MTYLFVRKYANLLLLGTYFEFSCIPATIFFLSICAGNCSVKNVRILFDILDTFPILSIVIIYS